MLHAHPLPPRACPRSPEKSNIYSAAGYTYTSTNLTMCNSLYRWRFCCRIELDNDTCPHTHAPLIHLARDSYSFDIVNWNHGNQTDVGINWKDFNLKFAEMTKLIYFTNRLSTAFFSQGKKNLLSFLFIAKFVVLRCTFCKLWRNFWVFLFHQSFELGAG